MIKTLRNANIAIIGGGRFCRELLYFFQNLDDDGQVPNILAVADIDPAAEGLAFARQQGIATIDDHTELYHLSHLNIILELTEDPEMADVIRRTMPEGIKLIDHFDARVLWDSLQIDLAKKSTLDQLERQIGDANAVKSLFTEGMNRFSAIVSQRSRRSRQIELELRRQQRVQAQVIQGSTIPTFVIDRNHIVTHWNRAMERFSGWPASKVVGTNKQWAPFWKKERPTMADVILDQIDEDEIYKLYGARWRPSPLIEGAYEAEIFFPSLGEEGKWCWFTAAPIKGSDGQRIGAIETLWDTTEDKKAKEQQEYHTRELSTLCAIYTALSAPWPIERRIEAAAREMMPFFNAEGICIYLLGDDGDFHLAYHYGDMACRHLPGNNAMVQEIGRQAELKIINHLDVPGNVEIEQLAANGIQSLAYIPISAKKEKIFGVIRIGSGLPELFTPEASHVLELIGNRVGVALENAILQEQYIKSEEKYRSLFNSDPHPIFIIDLNTLQIRDINQRALDCYGYSRKELVGMPFLSLGDPNESEISAALTGAEAGQSILLTKKRHFNKEGQQLFVNISISRAHYGERDVLVATTTDITESVEKDAQLIQAGKMTTLGVMAAGMAHEINQPLNVIQICADFFLKMLKRGQPVSDEDLKSMAEEIVTNVERATGIITHVRDFARQSDVVRTRVDLNKPIQDVFKVLGHQLKVHQIALDLDLDGGIPYILADHNRLEQVFINLVTNAIDAMDEKAEKHPDLKYDKKLTIKTFHRGSRVVAEVTDNGIGMNEEVRQKIFEPFYTTKKTGKGTGLGISISYGIIEDYEGHIDLESQPGRGTTFTISFPAHPQK